MRHAKNARIELGVRTTFNFIGPLANPFKAPIRLHGVSDYRMVDKYIDTLKVLGVSRAIVFCSKNSMDEFSISEITRGKKLVSGVVSDFEFDPTKFEFEPVDDEDIKGQDPKYNAEILKRVLSGVRCKQRGIVVANAAIGYSLVKDIGIAEAKIAIEDALDNKVVEGKYLKLIERSNSIWQ